MDVRQLWEELCALPHRGSATAQEALAAAKLKAYLERPRLASGGQEIPGHGVEFQPFKAPRSYGPELILISLLLALGGGLELWWLALLGTYGFWAHFSGWWVLAGLV